AAGVCGAGVGRTGGKTRRAGVSDQPAAGCLVESDTGVDRTIACPAADFPRSACTDPPGDHGGGSAGCPLADTGIYPGAARHRHHLLPGPACENAADHRTAADSACIVAGPFGLPLEPESAARRLWLRTCKTPVLPL